MTECTHQCISTPLAWFVIEQYRLGDLDHAAAAETERHLANCPACAEVHAYIEKDAAILPPLPERITPRKHARRSRRISYPALVGLSAAAGLLLVLLTVFTPAPNAPTKGIATKGGDLAVSLVRLRGEVAMENPVQFEDGDRFRLLLTTPAEATVPVEVVVFQGGEAFFPYPDTLTVEPGNTKGLDGAFTLTGSDDACVCVIAGYPLPSRDTLRQTGPSALPENSICQTLEAR
jgi:anti-sigma factor RsiW